MEELDLNKQNSNVAVLCEQYLLDDKNALSTLNQVIHLIADFALIDERRVDDADFDYAEELQELIFASKMMYHQMQRHNLLLMGNYGEYVANQQDKHAD